MIWLLLLLLVGCGSGGEQASVVPQPEKPGGPQVNLQVWHFNGQMASGTISGTITTDRTAVPFAIDGHNLSPNKLYHLVAWDVVLSPSLVEPNPILFAPENSTDEWCIGKCIFEPTFFNRILLKSADGVHTLQLCWEIPAIALPVTVEDWGSFTTLASELQGAGYVNVVETVTLTLEP